MVKIIDKNKSRIRRHKRVRSKITGTAECPRLNVFRSSQHIYAQVIDDVKGVTLAAASSTEKGFEGFGGNVEAAKKVGQMIAEKAKAAGITDVVFDRGGYVYHGRVSLKAQEKADLISNKEGHRLGTFRRKQLRAQRESCCYKPRFQDR